MSTDQEGHSPNFLKKKKSPNPLLLGRTEPEMPEDSTYQEQTTHHNRLTQSTTDTSTGGRVECKAKQHQCWSDLHEMSGRPLHTLSRQEVENKQSSLKQSLPPSTFPAPRTRTE